MNGSKGEDNDFVMRAQPKHDRRFTSDLIGVLRTQIEGKGGQIKRDQPKKLEANEISNLNKTQSNSIDLQ